MNMIVSATDSFGNRLGGANQASDVFMQSVTPDVSYVWMAILCAENDVIMEA